MKNENLKQVKSPNIYREYIHALLDNALDATKEGDSFLATFINLVLKELYRSEL